jgi:hypothetical protein
MAAYSLVFKPFFMKKEMVSNRYLPYSIVFSKPVFTSWLRKIISAEIISSLLIILFIYTSLSKLSAYDNFTAQLSKSPFITAYANSIAWSIPTVEILISLLLVIKKTQLIGLYASFFLMSLFTAYLIIMLNFSYHIPCSCGGVLQYLSWNGHIAFNAFFIAIAAAGVLLKEKEMAAHT